jgi:gamma-glutamyl phosphate reductase
MLKMLGKEINVFKSMLKRLKRNEKRLKKQAARVDQICNDYDEMLLSMLK